MHNRTLEYLTAAAKALRNLRLREARLYLSLARDEARALAQRVVDLEDTLTQGKKIILIERTQYLDYPIASPRPIPSPEDTPVSPAWQSVQN